MVRSGEDDLTQRNTRGAESAEEAARCAPSTPACGRRHEVTRSANTNSPLSLLLLVFADRVTSSPREARARRSGAQPIPQLSSPRICAGSVKSVRPAVWLCASAPPR